MEEDNSRQMRQRGVALVCKRLEVRLPSRPEQLLPNLLDVPLLFLTQHYLSIIREARHTLQKVARLAERLGVRGTSSSDGADHAVR